MAPVSILFTSLPRHIYCHVERGFISENRGLEPCCWFGLTSVPGRAWGLTVLLESGAIYSHLPPHAIIFDPIRSDLIPWSIQQAQLWDCFGYDFAVHEYAYLAGREVTCWVGHPSEIHEDARYLFTAQHYGDAYSMTPEQAKQFHFLQLANGRLACLPGNRLVVHAAEFSVVKGMPTDLRRQREEYSAE